MRLSVDPASAWAFASLGTWRTNPGVSMAGRMRLHLSSARIRRHICVAGRGSGFDTLRTPATHRTTTRLSEQMSSRAMHGPRCDPLPTWSKSCVGQISSAPRLSVLGVLPRRYDPGCHGPHPPVVVVVVVSAAMLSPSPSLQCSASSSSLPDKALSACDIRRVLERTSWLRISAMSIV